MPLQPCHPPIPIIKTTATIHRLLRPRPGNRPLPQQSHQRRRRLLLPGLNSTNTNEILAVVALKVQEVLEVQGVQEMVLLVVGLPMVGLPVVGLPAVGLPVGTVLTLLQLRQLQQWNLTCLVCFDLFTLCFHTKH